MPHPTISRNTSVERSRKPEGWLRLRGASPAEKTGFTGTLFKRDSLTADNGDTSLPSIQLTGLYRFSETRRQIWLPGPSAPQRFQDGIESSTDDLIIYHPTRCHRMVHQCPVRV
ncbi:MAG: hypothetical protein AAFZ80_12120 [Cyanobacteria bacterium P01_A01_bin.105]